MGEFIKALESKQLIQRRNGEQSRRVILVSSTPAGRKLLAASEARVDEAQREFVACLGAEELASLRMILSRVRTAELARLKD